jgi:tripartite-type tricarboxylate transporter receptor subunit TctC
MYMSRRRAVACAMGCLLLATAPAVVRAQAYPAKTIRYVVPFAAGGGVDTLARTVAARLNAAWNVPVVVENRPGAGGNIGTEAVARSAPDGYTLLMTPNSHAYNASLYRNPPYHPVRDFAPVGFVATSPFLLVIHPSLPVKSVRDLIVLAKARPKELTYASGGVGGGSHLAGELFSSMAGIAMIHVPYKGIAPAVSDLLGGHVTLSFSVVPPAIPHVNAGRLRVLAVSSAARSTLFPELPTIGESGLKGYDAFSWYATFVPAGTPQPIVDKLNAEIGRSLRAPDVQAKLAAIGLEVKTGSPDEFARFMLADWNAWDKIIRSLGIRAD